MKRKKLSKLYLIFGACIGLALIGLIPSLNISCDSNNAIQQYVAPGVFSNLIYGIRLNGGAATSGTGGGGGTFQPSVSGSGNLNVGTGSPTYTIPTDPGTTPDIGPSSDGCEIIGTVNFSDLDVGTVAPGQTEGTDCGLGVVPDAEWPVNGPLVITGTLVMDKNGGGLIYVTGGSNNDFILGETGQIVCEDDGSGGTNSLTIFAYDNVYIRGAINCSGVNAGDDGGDVNINAGHTSNDEGDLLLTGTINTSGADAPGGGGKGGDGGEVKLTSNNDPGTGTATSILVAGHSINTSGGAAVGANAGGDAADINLHNAGDPGTVVHMYVTGDITMDGGASPGGTGGNGGQLDVDTEISDGDGMIILDAESVDANISANGGDGLTGGDGGSVSLYTDNMQIVLKYDIDANGGDGTDGGEGGVVEPYTYGDGSIFVLGRDAFIQANGGPSLTGTGGEGGQLENLADEGSINLIGRFQGDAGDGGTNGGDGCYLGSVPCNQYCARNIISTGSPSSSLNSDMVISCNGGDGGDDGGHGGDIKMEVTGATGTNDGKLSARGGDGGNGAGDTGGDGADITLEVVGGGEFVDNTGLDTGSTDSAVQGGDATIDGSPGSVSIL